MKQGGAQGGKMPEGGLSNADHLSLPATASKPLPPISWAVAMETASAQLLWRQELTHEEQRGDGEERAAANVCI